MSRHRNLRNMIQEDEYDYDDDDDDYYDDDGGEGDYYVKPKPPPPKPAVKQQQQPNMKKAGAAAAVSNKNVPKQQQQQQQQKQQQPKLNIGISSPPPATTAVVPTAAVVSKTTTSAITNTQTNTTNVMMIPSILLQKIDNNDTYYKPTLSVVILGHVDAGKSTLTGRLLYSSSSNSSMSMTTTNITSNANMNTTINKKGKIISNINNNNTNATNNTINYAWLLDEDDKERQHNITMDVGIKLYETPATIPYHILLYDSPGHIDYIPCMLTGTYYADSICFVIDVTNAMKSLYNGGQLREHIYLARGLSNLPTTTLSSQKIIISNDKQQQQVIQQRNKSVLVICNKMDLIQWDYKKFIHIKQLLLSFLTSQQIGYHTDQIQFIPVSGYNGINVITKCSDNDNNTTTTNNKKSKKMIMNQNQITDEVVTSSNNNNNIDWMNEYPTLQDVLLNHLIMPNMIRKKLLMKPLRILITEVDIDNSGTNMNSNKNSIIVRIKIIQGYMSINEPLLVLPIQDIVMIPKIITRNLQLLNSSSPDHKERNLYGVPGDLLECYMKLTSTTNTTNNDIIDVQRISVGSILCQPNDNTKPIPSNIIRARIILLDLYTSSQGSDTTTTSSSSSSGVVPIIRGTSCIFHIQYIDIPCYFSKLLYTFQLSKSTNSTTTPPITEVTTQSSSSNNKKIAKNQPSQLPPQQQQQSKQNDSSNNNNNNNNTPFIIERINPRALTFPNHHHHIQTQTYNNNNNNITNSEDEDKSSFYHDDDNETSSWAMVEITLNTPICMEPYHICRTLGQFVLRRNGISIAIGRIEQVLPSTITTT